MGIEYDDGMMDSVILRVIISSVGATRYKEPCGCHSLALLAGLGWRDGRGGEVQLSQWHEV